MRDLNFILIHNYYPKNISKDLLRSFKVLKFIYQTNILTQCSFLCTCAINCGIWLYSLGTTNSLGTTSVIGKIQWNLFGWLFKDSTALVLTMNDPLSSFSGSSYTFSDQRNVVHFIFLINYILKKVLTFLLYYYP